MAAAIEGDVRGGKKKEENVTKGVEEKSVWVIETFVTETPWMRKLFLLVCEHIRVTRNVRGMGGIKVRNESAKETCSKAKRWPKC